MRVEIVTNDNPKEREDARGRVHVSHRRTFVVLVNGEVFTECRTMREAKKAADAKRTKGGA